MRSDAYPLIVVDADACPVKAEVAEAARTHGVPALFVASYAHRLEPWPGVEIVQVDRGDQAADLYIANRLRAGDIVVTQDFGLAALAIAKSAVALSFRGQRYRPETIDFLLDRRHEQARIRRGGGRHKGPRPFTEEDRLAFLHSLTKVLRGLQDN
ncbi:YaiI/YqxD family protein [Paenibacillus thermoaerophilus]|uniref:UPF0178 protein ACFQWB_01510 n=1 Tax=Paenibacillus thermoaerophilus TaxID=1215385 RepID=A0ABW2V054_9BACL|nr:YaiI/YqxD family protein [Paenibacillus thermoaerophilus]TMV19036.1 YaiI/YqxD family protein [Paenibacillus thermoaerophilus]